MYKNLMKLKKHHQLAYSLLIAFALITLWRGIWRLLDYYFFPNDFVSSSILPLILGVVILAAAHYKLG